MGGGDREREKEREMGGGDRERWEEEIERERRYGRRR